jgi:hypothetical protein
MRAIEFGVAGAQPEALGELETARNATKNEKGSPLDATLNAQYLSSTAPGKAKPIVSTTPQQGESK